MLDVLVRRIRLAGAAAWLILGAGQLFGAPKWRTSNSYAVIRELLPLRVWGAVFLAVGVAQAVELLWRPASHRAGYAIVTVGVAVAAAWAVSFAAAALVGQLTGFGGFALYGYVAATQFAVAGAPVAHRRRLRRRSRRAIHRSRGSAGS